MNLIGLCGKELGANSHNAMYAHYNVTQQSNRCSSAVSESLVTCKAVTNKGIVSCVSVGCCDFSNYESHSHVFINTEWSHNVKHRRPVININDVYDNCAVTPFLLRDSIIFSIYHNLKLHDYLKGEII